MLRRDGSLKLEVLACADDTGTPVEESDGELEILGAVVLRRGESAVLAGMIHEERATAKTPLRLAGAGRRAMRGSVERVEWMFLVTPRIPAESELSRRAGKPSGSAVKQAGAN